VLVKTLGEINFVQNFQQYFWKNPEFCKKKVMKLGSSSVTEKQDAKFPTGKGQSL
jgi:hypothetical protein